MKAIMRCVLIFFAQLPALALGAVIVQDDYYQSCRFEHDPARFEGAWGNHAFTIFQRLLYEHMSEDLHLGGMSKRTHDGSDECHSSPECNQADHGADPLRQESLDAQA